jgi:hypothetical protein
MQPPRLVIAELSRVASLFFGGLDTGIISNSHLPQGLLLLRTKWSQGGQ